MKIALVPLLGVDPPLRARHHMVTSVPVPEPSAGLQVLLEDWLEVAQLIRPRLPVAAPDAQNGSFVRLLYWPLSHHLRERLKVAVEKVVDDLGGVSIERRKVQHVIDEGDELQAVENHWVWEE
ncbi:hypothetical protein F5Y06DRAFT_299169 [Hypoxylon sp. FL0890]|nr:hypothetical protein F5Y06DRAFT_299169 [Hypoxylon sp. FL0890]